LEVGREWCCPRRQRLLPCSRSLGQRTEESYDLGSFITELDSSYFNYYVDGRYYDFFPERKVTYKMILLVEEMHRLHVNTWKNFPWKSYLYENLDK